MLRWARRVARRRLESGPGDTTTWRRLERLDESGDLEAYYAARLDGRGRTSIGPRGGPKGSRRASSRVSRGASSRGSRQGLAAERELLCRLAMRKFDAGTAERLAGLLARIGDTRRLAEVGDWIIDCATGDDLIARFGNGVGSDS